MSLPLLTVYSRPGCHLCDDLLEELRPLVRGRALVEVRNIDASAELADRYGESIPVVALDGRELCRFRLDRDAVLGALRS